jgi:hypothetical protein
MADQMEKLRAWADEQVQLLKRQRDGIDRRIAEIQSFSKVLGELGEDGVRGVTMAQLERNAAAHAGNNGARPDSMPGRIAAVLREQGRPMKAAEIASVLETQGLKYEGKHPLKIIVSTELARQSKKHAYGIRKLGSGRYAAA